MYDVLEFWVKETRYFFSMEFDFDLTLFSKINTFCTNNDVTYIIMPRTAQESSVYLFPLWSFHNKIAD